MVLVNNDTNTKDAWHFAEEIVTLVSGAPTSRRKDPHFDAVNGIFMGAHGALQRVLYAEHPITFAISQNGTVFGSDRVAIAMGDEFAAGLSSNRGAGNQLFAECRGYSPDAARRFLLTRLINDAFIAQIRYDALLPRRSSYPAGACMTSMGYAVAYQGNRFTIFPPASLAP